MNKINETYAVLFNDEGHVIAVISNDSDFEENINLAIDEHEAEPHFIFMETLKPMRFSNGERRYQFQAKEQGSNVKKTYLLKGTILY